MAESVDNYHSQRQSHNTTATYCPFVTSSGRGGAKSAFQSGVSMTKMLIDLNIRSISVSLAVSQHY